MWMDNHYTWKNIIIEDQLEKLEVNVTSVQTEPVVDIFINEFAGL